MFKHRTFSKTTLESIWRQHSAAGISEETLALLCTGWSTGTNSAYQTGWKWWSSWCQRRQVDPVSCRVQVYFIIEGLEYRTNNLIRSAVSSTHEAVDGTPIGQHPQFLRECTTPDLLSHGTLALGM